MTRFKQTTQADQSARSRDTRVAHVGAGWSRACCVDIPKTLDQRTAQKLLERHGWTPTTGGKHAVKMRKPGHRPITLPKHRGAQCGRGLTHEILRQAGLR